MHPKFIIVSRPEEPLVGSFVYAKWIAIDIWWKGT